MFPVFTKSDELNQCTLEDIFKRDDICTFAYPTKLLNQTVVTLIAALITAELKRAKILFKAQDWQHLLEDDKCSSLLLNIIRKVDEVLHCENFMTIPLTSEHHEVPLRDIAIPHILGGESTKAHWATVRHIDALCSCCTSVLTHTYHQLTAPVAKYWSTNKTHSRMYSVITLDTLWKSILANMVIENEAELFLGYPWDCDDENNAGAKYTELIGTNRFRANEYAVFPVLRPIAIKYEDCSNTRCWLCHKDIHRAARKMYLAAEDALKNTEPQFKVFKKIDFGSMYSAVLQHPNITYRIKDKAKEGILAPQCVGKYGYPIWYQLTFNDEKTLVKAKVIQQFQRLESTHYDDIFYDNDSPLGRLLKQVKVTSFGICNKQGRDIALITYNRNEISVYRSDEITSNFIHSADVLLKNLVDRLEELKKKTVVISGKGINQKLMISKETRSSDLTEIAHNIDQLWRYLANCIEEAQKQPIDKRNAFYDNALTKFKGQIKDVWEDNANPEFTELRVAFHAFYLIAWAEKRFWKQMK